ncbi:hypothetical protein ACFQ05_23970 [Amycolatopsis umgeniensis]|uniref:Uncharacterized protein n=1 Tax=Amycolatopsis umgeniensis TaxID=336628 RepID=A0A841AVB4_9PSEU|nr:hypothetical protein [Amycolatopsis umgeniensis]MBB5850272.1 hypothetical protein [Amycolatopsis umgeniensis]
MGSVVSGLAGALIGLVGVLLGAGVTSRYQDRRWLREQKLKGAAEFIAAGMHLYESQLSRSDQHRVTTAERVAWQDRLQTGRSQVHLLCRSETREAADKFAGLVWRYEGTKKVSEEADVVEALRGFTDTIRREIRSGR